MQNAECRVKGALVGRCLGAAGKQTLTVCKDGRFVNRPYGEILKFIVGIGILDCPQKQTNLRALQTNKISLAKMMRATIKGD